MTDHELDSLREKRRKELIAQALKRELEQKKQEESKHQFQEQQMRASMIVNQVLEPDARTYMDWLTKNNPPVAQTIKDTIILIIHKRMLRRPLAKVDILRLEREITGKEPKILVKRRGREATDLKEKIKKERENDE
jgi:DNA-binding TFAR19-related protein (PDSD5 family)